MIKNLLIAIFLMSGTCLGTGCLLPASYVAGYSNPKAKVYVNKLTGKLEAEIGTDFTGRMELDFDPETKKSHLVAEVTSKASDVNLSQAVKAEAITPLQQAQMDMISRNFEAAMSFAGQVTSAFMVARTQQPSSNGGPSPVSEIVSELKPMLQQMLSDELNRRGMPQPAPSP